MLHKYGFIFLNRLRISANTVFSNPRTANYWKLQKNGLPLKHLYKYIVTYLYSIFFIPNSIPKTYPAHRNENVVFFIIGSEVIAYYIKAYSFAPCDDFHLPLVPRANQWYNYDIRDFADNDVQLLLCVNIEDNNSDVLCREPGPVTWLLLQLSESLFH